MLKLDTCKKYIMHGNRYYLMCIPIIIHFDSLVEISLDSLGALVQNIHDLPNCLHLVLNSLDLTKATLEDEESGKTFVYSVNR